MDGESTTWIVRNFGSFAMVVCGRSIHVSGDTKFALVHSGNLFAATRRLSHSPDAYVMLSLVDVGVASQDCLDIAAVQSELR